MQWTQKGHEFDIVAEKLLKKETTYRLWGAAQLGSDFCEILAGCASSSPVFLMMYSA